MDQNNSSDKAPPLTPQELFAKCKENEAAPSRQTFEKLFSLIAEVLTFSVHPFQADPQLDAPPSPEDSDDLKTQRVIRYGVRYREILKVLKEQRSNEARLIFLAAWLKQEGICHPIDFLPADVYKGVIAEKRQSVRISIADQQQYHRVEAWQPYFERLMADRKTMREAKLAQAGYEKSAVAAAHGKRVAIPAVCDFLAARGGPDATTLRNAHSRVSKRHKIADASL